MLTGDADAVGQDVARRLGLDRAYTELLPADKADRVEELLEQKGEKGMLALVGDGINDAPVLARADVGIAMGVLGSDAAIEAADVVLMTDEPSKIAAVMQIARKTIRISNENIVFALGVKFLVLILGRWAEPICERRWPGNRQEAASVPERAQCFAHDCGEDRIKA